MRQKRHKGSFRFYQDGFHGELSDIDFSKAYCVYVEAGILEKDPKNLKDLRETLESGKLISADKETEEKFVLIGGEPEFHYLMAVRVEGEKVTEVFPLDGELPEAENKSLSRAFYIVCAVAVGILIVLIVEEKFAGKKKKG